MSGRATSPMRARRASQASAQIVPTTVNGHTGSGWWMMGRANDVPLCRPSARRVIQATGDHGLGRPTRPTGSTVS